MLYADQKTGGICEKSKQFIGENSAWKTKDAHTESGSKTAEQRCAYHWEYSIAHIPV